ncbi:MAG: hypothetical protein RIS44_2646 [Pseudomonadota bacterium]|jgi:hypothetical protein
MKATDSRLPAALEASLDYVRAAAAAAAERVSQAMAAQATTTARVTERDMLFKASQDLKQQPDKFLAVVADTLTENTLHELAPRTGEKRTLAMTDWQSLSLVDDNEVEERMFADRLGQQISHASEWELREMAAYMASLMGLSRADEDRNPVRGSAVGAAIYKGVQAISAEPDVRKLLHREFGLALAQLMPASYKNILTDLKNRGVKPLGLSVKAVDGPGHQLPGLNSAYAPLRDDHISTRSGSSGFGSSSGGELNSGRDLTGAASKGPSGLARANAGHGGGGGGATASAGGDAQLMALLRRLTALSSRPGILDEGGARRLPPDTNMGDMLSATALGALGADRGAAGAAGYGDGLTGLMAVNLIRAHREELRQASSGALDHMVIDVVGSLFDQILSDNRVPPQMARQIARLQLPVLRVALADPTFFSSRKHPVRRFVNKMASMACAYEEFDDGPGKKFLARVRELVQELVEGDFDQVDLYATKLNELEAFVAQLTHDDVQAHNSAAALLENKESELRIQQRYMLQLQSALTPIQLPTFLRDFLSQVWSQALVLTSRRDGLNSEIAKRMRLVGRDLVMSVQPKGSLPMRKKFLMQLPALMKDLNEGLRLVGWPEDAQKQFFAQLLPAHSESLKQPALSELDHNLLVKQLDAIFNAAMPGQESGPRHEAVTSLSEAEIEKRFTPEEAKSVGLLEESAVDWAGEVVDIDLSEDLGATQPASHMAEGAAEANSAVMLGATGNAPLDLDLGLGVDINLDLNTADPAEVTQGAHLIDHIKVGFAYQMHLKDEWQKVRLSFVSPGRSFFVFTHGRKHQQTVSLTARMLSRMCESGRMRAVESTYLMERATARARAQLAALKSTPKSVLTKH